MVTNTLLTPSAITREALRILHQKLTFVGSINRQYDKEFAKEGAKIGDSLRIRLPNQYKIRKGSTYSAQPTTNKYTTLQVNQIYGADIEFSSFEMTMSLDKVAEQVLEPAMAVIAANIEADVLTDCVQSVYNMVPNMGNAASYKQFLKGRQQLQDNLAPPTKRTALMNTTDNVDMVDSLKTLFNPNDSLAKQFREGMMGRAGGLDFGETTHMVAQARGAGAGYLVNGATQSGSQVIVDTGTGAINKGEVFTYANVYAVHPETKKNTGRLQQFVVTEDYAGGNGTLKFSPPLNADATDAYQNVNALPADNAAITLTGTANTAYNQSLIYQEDAFTFATADLVIDESMAFAAREVYDGISMRLAKFWDGVNDKVCTRFDVAAGWKTLRAQLASRVANN